LSSAKRLIQATDTPVAFDIAVYVNALGDRDNISRVRSNNVVGCCSVTVSPLERATYRAKKVLPIVKIRLQPIFVSGIQLWRSALLHGVAGVDRNTGQTS
jgi:hypothetical protein